MHVCFIVWQWSRSGAPCRTAGVASWRTGAGKFANSSALSPYLCLNPSIRDLAEPHSCDLFFSLEARSRSHLISPFFCALWLNMSYSCVFSLWGNTALIANQLDSSSAGSGSKALPNFSRLLCVHLLLFWVRWDRWVMLLLPLDLGL